MATDPSGIIAQLLGFGQQQQENQLQRQQVLNQTDTTQQNLQINAAKIAAAQAQQQQASLAQDNYYRDPSHENLVRYASAAPDKAEALYKGAQLLDTDAKQSQTNQNAVLFNLADKGSPDQLVSHLDGLITAEKSAGIDTSDAQGIRDELASGDPQRVAAARTAVAAHTRIQLAALGAKGFSIDPDGADAHFHVVGGSTFDDRTGDIHATAPTKAQYRTVNTVDEDGNPITQIVEIGQEGGGPASSGGASGGSSGAPLSVRLNNPGAIRANPANKWQGQVGTDNGFVKFDTAANGERAHRVLIANQIKSGYDTPLTWAQHYAPSSDGNDPAAYAQTVANRLGIGVNDKIPLSAVPQVAAASAAVESGGSPSASKPKITGTGANVVYQVKSAPKGAAGGPNTLFDQDTLETLAQQYRAGDKTVFQNLGRGAQGAQNVVALRREVVKQARADGQTGSDIAAQMADFTGTLSAERAAGTRIAQVDLAATEAQKLIPLALQASNDLPRNGFLPFSKAQQSIRNGTNDPRLRKFVAANNALVNVYSRAVSPTGAPTVADKDHARELLDTAYDQKSYSAVVGQMQAEIQAAKAAPRSVRSDIRAGVSAGGSRPAAPQGWTVRRIN